MFIDLKLEKFLQLRQELNMPPLAGLLAGRARRVYKHLVPTGLPEPRALLKVGLLPPILHHTIRESDPADQQFPLVDHFRRQAIV
jgi:hypothetical protein